MAEPLIDNVTIRLMRLDADAAQLRPIVQSVWTGSGYALMEQRFGEIGGKPWHEWLWRAIEADLQAEPGRSFVAEADGRIVGFCAYSIEPERSRGTVGYNGVAPAFQGRGLGSAMLRFILARIKDEGMQYAAVVVQDNEQHAPARHMYEKHGFERLAGNHFLVQKLDAEPES